MHIACVPSGADPLPKQFSSVPWLIGLSEGHERWFSMDPLPVFSAGGPCEQFWHRQGCPLFDVVHPAIPLPTTASPTIQGAPKDGFGEAVVVWHAQTMQVSVSRQLPEEVPVDSHKSWSCSAPSHWSCAPSRRYGEVTSSTWFWKPGRFFQSASRVYVSQL